MSEETRKYVWSQINVNFVLNLILNGILAWLLNRSKDFIPVPDMIFDLTVTTILLVFIVSILGGAGTSKAIKEGKLPQNAWQPGTGIMVRWSSMRNLGRSVLLAVFMTLVLIPVLYGVFSLLGVMSMPMMGYVIFKAFFAGLIAGIAAWLSNLGALGETSVNLDAAAA